MYVDQAILRLTAQPEFYYYNPPHITAREKKKKIRKHLHLDLAATSRSGFPRLIDIG